MAKKMLEQLVDVTKCSGCRNGISLFSFSEEDDQYIHVDFLATKEHGISYKCENSDEIEKYLVKNGDRGTYLPSEDYDEYFKNQEFWWEDIIDLSTNIFDDENKRIEFLKSIIDKPNEEVENELLKKAKEEGVEVDEEEFPDLLKWNDKKNDKD